LELVAVANLCEILRVKRLTVDSHQRIRIPDATPHTVFAYENHGDGTITLTIVKAEIESGFPRGSLTKYLTEERNVEQLAILKGCVQWLR
jgi:hypothetical protein